MSFNVNKFRDVMDINYLRNLLMKREEELAMEKNKNQWLWILAIIGGIVLIAAIAYGVYRFLSSDYLEDFDDDFEDDFDDDFDDDFFEEEAEAIAE